MMVKELKVEKKGAAPIRMFLQTKGDGGWGGGTKKYGTFFFWREVSYSRNFAFCGRVWDLNPCKK